MTTNETTLENKIKDGFYDAITNAPPLPTIGDSVNEISIPSNENSGRANKIEPIQLIENRMPL
ncbi:hypothetical protein [Alkaliphilus hydrothermalis]|nr:hypothetical protein [Alkaliphilus hydrothermalis]